MLTQEEIRDWYGWAELSPEGPIEAGSLGRWQITYHAGRYGVAAGGSLKLLFPDAGDWPALQGRDPYDENFVTVTATGRAEVAWRWDPRGYVRPWQRTVTVDVARAPLVAGDSVLIYLGDPEGGSPGVRAQTFCMPGYEFRLVVDVAGSGHYVAVPSPAADIAGGPPAGLVVVVPSQVAPGEPFDAIVRVEDRWGNLTGYAETVRLEGLPGLGALEFAGAQGLGRVRATAPAEGIYRICARAEGLGATAESNPLVAGEAGAYQPLWGDLHALSIAPEPESVEACFRHARDVAGLDFCAQQIDDRQITPALWSALQSAVRAFDEPDRFAALLGYRWAGNTAGGGPRGVLFPESNAPLFRCHPGEGGAEAVCFPLPRLFEALRGHDALVIAGVGSPMANLAHQDPGMSPLIEIYTSEGEAYRLLEESLQRGVKAGLVAGSAAPHGRPGGGGPGAGELVGRGGLTCVYAAARTREAVWEALRARRCYATTGARILLDVQADGHPMGAVYRAARPPQFQVRVAGTAEIERIEIWRGLQVAYRYPEEDVPRPGWVRVEWGGALAPDWPRQAPWDGTLRCHEARILAAQPYGFDTPARGIWYQDEHAVSWRSITAGNANGLLLQLEGGPKACLELHTPLATWGVPLAALPYRQDLGGEGLYIRIEPWARGTGEREVAFSWADTTLPPGATPYYLVVYQVDGAKAWSSPIYPVSV